jgi:glycosyltransferase involved in cell wall biosynthesis
MKPVFFSFVLPAFKAKFLREAIESILNQSYTNYELIIVNDASPENLEEIIGSFNDTRIHYYQNEKNAGGQELIRHWNQCITYAQGEYLILASDDDVYSPDFLTEIAKLIARYPELDLYKARARKIDAQNRILEMDPQFASYNSFIDFLYNRRKGMISCLPNYVFRLSTLREQGGFVDFPAAWHSDAATVDLLAQKGIAITDQTLFSFRSSGINLSNQSKLSVGYDKIEATRLYEEWFDTHIHLQAQTDNEDFLIQQIKQKRKDDIAYMCAFILCPYSLPNAIRLIRKMHIINLLSTKQSVKLLARYILRRLV